MTFSNYPGFTITRLPDAHAKNSSRNFRRAVKAPRQPIRGDLTPQKAEAVLWLRPTNKYRSPSSRD